MNTFPLATWSSTEVISVFGGVAAVVVTVLFPGVLKFIKDLNGLKLEMRAMIDAQNRQLNGQDKKLDSQDKKLDDIKTLANGNNEKLTAENARLNAEVVRLTARLAAKENP